MGVEGSPSTSTKPHALQG